MQQKEIGDENTIISSLIVHTNAYKAIKNELKSSEDEAKKTPVNK